MADEKWNAPLILPFTKNVKALDSYINNNRIVLKMLRLHPFGKNYYFSRQIVRFLKWN